MRKDAESAAGPLRLKIHSVPLASARDLDSALGAIERLRPGALLVHALAGTTFVHAQRFAEVAVKLRIPSISSARQLAEGGLLMSYGADIRQLQPRVAFLVDRILKGDKPAVLPVERPTKFELTLNLRTAKAIGLAIPQSLRLRADELIE